MSVLTADQLNTIAESLLSIARAIDKYIDDPPAPLTPEQVSAFEDQRDKIENEVETIADMALTINLDNAEAAVTKLNTVTEHIGDDIMHLTNIQKVINLAGSALTLVSAIIQVETNPGGVVSAIGGVINSVEAITDPAD